MEVIQLPESQPTGLMDFSKKLRLGWATLSLLMACHNPSFPWWAPLHRGGMKTILEEHSFKDIDHKLVLLQM